MNLKLILTGAIVLSLLWTLYPHQKAQAISAITVVGLPLGDPATVEFDNSNAYLGYDYRSTEFCNEAASRILIQKMNLATGVRTTLVQGTGFCSAAAYAFAPDSTHLYYVRALGGGASIRRVTIATPAVENLVLNVNATSLLVDATNLYWTTATQVQKRAKIGGAIQTLYTAPAGVTVRLLGRDNTQLFFDQYTGLGAAQIHDIRKVPSAGGLATTLRTLPTGRYLTGFTSDVNNVYWTEQIWGNSLNGFVQRVSKGGVGFHTIATLPPVRRAHKMAVTNTKVYWIETLGFDVRDRSVVRSRTNPTGFFGVFADETPLRQGIGAIGSLSLWLNAGRMFWYEYNWVGARLVVRGNL